MSSTKNTNPRGWHYIEELLKNTAFEAEVEKIRSIKTPTVQTYLAGNELMRNHRILMIYHDLIMHFVKTGKLNKDLVGHSVRVVSDHSETVEPADDPHELWETQKYLGSKGIYLKLSKDITQPELIKFITTHWSDLIKPRIEEVSGKRKRISYAFSPTKARQIYNDYANRKLLKLTAEEIARKHYISRAQLYRIVKRQKNVS